MKSGNSRLMLRLLSLLLICATAHCWRQQQSCRCDFRQLKQELQQLYNTGQNNAQMVYTFVRSLTLLNLKLPQYLSEFRMCVQHWVATTASCNDVCSCQLSHLCCRKTALLTLKTSAQMLRKHTRISYTELSGIGFLSDYLDVTMDIISSFTFFTDFIDSLQTNQSINYKKHVVVFIEKLRQRNPLSIMLNSTEPKVNASQSIISRIVAYYKCNMRKIIPFYLNFYGSMLEYMLMEELSRELKNETQGFANQYARRALDTRLAHMTKHMVYCSTKEIGAVKTQEIKEQDMAMRNAGLVFSSFLLILIIIIAFIAALAWKAANSTGDATPQERPAVPTVDAEHRRRPLYKRHYEAEDTL